MFDCCWFWLNEVVLERGRSYNSCCRLRSLKKAKSLKYTSELRQEFTNIKHVMFQTSLSGPSPELVLTEMFQCKRLTTMHPRCNERLVGGELWLDGTTEICFEQMRCTS